MTIDMDTLGKDLSMYRARMDEHLKNAVAHENAAKECRSRASACAGAIEAVQRFMDLAGKESAETVPGGDGSGVKGTDDAGN